MNLRLRTWTCSIALVVAACEGEDPECVEEPTWLYSRSGENFKAMRVSQDRLCRAIDCPPTLDEAIEAGSKVDAGVGRFCRFERISGCGVDTITILNYYPAVLWNYDSETGRLIGAGADFSDFPVVEGCSTAEQIAGEARRPDCDDVVVEPLCPGSDDEIDAGI